MKKPINSHQKTNAEYDHSCQECRKNEAVIKLEGSGWMASIQGKFCEECAIKKIKYWYCKDMPEFHLICADCGRYKDQQAENNRVLREVEMSELLKEIQRRMKENKE
ncbi:hypothetical protein [endosymbiont GvMRE of Glomus versiforme]|uniref:hypothetical protein n=1 Tax=endosymbiont GvMRE of Glomus versiforme TaxID=2039283 RepID=UPI000ED6696B|nr:hypothetical protein [endosymbiont GvMRE of Glomus versiforme]RHZ35874.1 hypothetical protein GvMRE_Ic4g8 [endosymbiont GvMRE of Glomus versiforme]RHZ36168.1 hypothetical protein GvMRE_Ic2g1 [endosymbiont GvMRE of Glomus versiforme]